MARKRSRQLGYIIALLVICAASIAAQVRVAKPGIYTKPRFVGSALLNNIAIDIDTLAVGNSAWIMRKIDSLISVRSGPSNDSIRDYIALPFASVTAILPHNSGDTTSNKGVLGYAGMYIRSAPLAQMPGSAAARYGGWAVNVDIQASDTIFKWSGTLTLLGFTGGSNLTAGDILFFRFIPQAGLSIDKTLRLYRLPGLTVPSYITAGANYGEVIGEALIPASNFPTSILKSVYITVTLTYYGRHAK